MAVCPLSLLGGGAPAVCHGVEWCGETLSSQSMVVPGLEAGSFLTWSAWTQGGVGICKGVLLFFFSCGHKEGEVSK